MSSISREFARLWEAAEKVKSQNDNNSQFIQNADFDTFKEGVNIEVKYLWQSVKAALSSIEELEAENKKLQHDLGNHRDWLKQDMKYLVSLSYQNPETKDKIRDQVSVLFDKYLIEVSEELTEDDKERFNISKYDAIRALLLDGSLDVSDNLLWNYICCHPKFKGEKHELGEDDLVISGYRWNTDCEELMQRMKRMKNFVIEHLE